MVHPGVRWFLPAGLSLWIPPGGLAVWNHRGHLVRRCGKALADEIGLGHGRRGHESRAVQKARLDSSLAIFAEGKTPQAEKTQRPTERVVGSAGRQRSLLQNALHL